MPGKLRAVRFSFFESGPRFCVWRNSCAEPAASSAENAQMDQQHPIDRLNALIQSRRGAPETESYTAALLAKGKVACAKKLGEEAVEAALAAAAGDNSATIKESADLLYHLLVLWAAVGIEPEDVYAELRARESQSGLQEKLKRSR
jgi:phosphoribosyl-ATP pyrophosphohydrolase